MWIDPPSLSFHSPLTYFSLTLSYILLFYLLHPFLHPVPQPLSSSLTPSLSPAPSPSLTFISRHSLLHNFANYPFLPSPPFFHHVFFFWYSKLATLLCSVGRGDYSHSRTPLFEGKKPENQKMVITIRKGRLLLVAKWPRFQPNSTYVSILPKFPK